MSLPSSQKASKNHHRKRFTLFDRRWLRYRLEHPYLDPGADCEQAHPLCRYRYSSYLPARPTAAAAAHHRSRSSSSGKSRSPARRSRPTANTSLSSSPIRAPATSGSRRPASHSAPRARSAPRPRARSATTSGAAIPSIVLYAQDAGGDENFNIYAIDPSAACRSQNRACPRPARSPTCKKVRTEIFAAPKSKPDILYIGLNDRDPHWHDLYELHLSTGEKNAAPQQHRADRRLGL